MIVERSCYRIPSRRSKMREANRLAADYQSRRIERNVCIQLSFPNSVTHRLITRNRKVAPSITPFRTESSTRTKPRVFLHAASSSVLASCFVPSKRNPKTDLDLCHEGNVRKIASIARCTQAELYNYEVFLIVFSNVKRDF